MTRRSPLGGSPLGRKRRPDHHHEESLYHHQSCDVLGGSDSFDSFDSFDSHRWPGMISERPILAQGGNELQR